MTGGAFWVWTGDAWVKRFPKVWLDGAWVQCLAYRWTGSAWLPVNPSDIPPAA